MKTTNKENVVTDAKKDISSVDKVYGYGALLVLSAGTVYAFTTLASANEQLMGAAGVIIVLFATKSVIRLFK